MINKNVSLYVSAPIISIFIITAGIFVWKYDEIKQKFDKKNKISQKQETPIIQKDLSTIHPGHKVIDHGNGVYSTKDDECITDDFEYVKYGLKRIIYTVEPNDNLWNILAYNLEQQELVRQLKQDEITMVLDHIKNKMKKMSPDELRQIGIQSGNLSQLTTGDQVNLSPLILNAEEIKDNTNINLLSYKNSTTYRKNKNYVCWYKILIRGADPETFIAFDNGSGMDKNSVYVRHDSLKDVDKDTLIFLDKHYSKDKKNVYGASVKIEGVDLESFELIKGTSYAKDKTSVYFSTERMEGIDPNLAQFFIGGFMRSGSNIYKANSLIKGINAAKFTAIDNNYSKDDTNVFYNRNVTISTIENRPGNVKKATIQGANVDKFVAINASYSKDDKNVYCKGKILPEADVKTFTSPSDNYSERAEDKNNTYQACKPTPKK